MMTTIRQRLCCLAVSKVLATSVLASSFSLISANANAENYTLAVKVTVVDKTCDISGPDGTGQPFTVDMGDLSINKIDGVSYGKTDIDYLITCDDGNNNPALKLKFDGPRMSGQAANVLSTSDPNLGLRLMANNSNINLGTWRNFNYQNKPVLSVIPKGSGSGGINDGQMTASATLSVEYQ